MAEDKIFAKGIRFFPKHENAPDFVLGTMIMSKDDLIEWLNGSEASQHFTDYQGQKQIKFQITKGRSGALVMSVDTYKPTQNYSPPTTQQQAQPQAQPQAQVQKDQGYYDLPQDDLPF